MTTNRYEYFFNILITVFTYDLENNSQALVRGQKEHANPVSKSRKKENPLVSKPIYYHNTASYSVFQYNTKTNLQFSSPLTSMPAMRYDLGLSSASISFIASTKNIISSLIRTCHNTVGVKHRMLNH